MILIPLRQLTHGRYARRLLNTDFRSVTFVCILRTQKLVKTLSLSLWIVVLTLSIIFAVILMLLVWERFRTTPTITTIETNNYPIWNVNFPAVTICDINKVYRPLAEPIMAKL